MGALQRWRSSNSTCFDVMLMHHELSTFSDQIHREGPFSTDFQSACCTAVVVPLGLPHTRQVFCKQRRILNWFPVRGVSLGVLAALTWHGTPASRSVHAQSSLDSLSRVTEPGFWLKGRRTDACSPTVGWSDVQSPRWFFLQFTVT